MKKIITVLAFAVTLFAISCQKQEQDFPVKDVQGTISKTFRVSMPETKTVLGEGSVSGSKAVLFSDGDIIKVFANTTGNAYQFTYSEADDEFSAEIDESDANETDFYAVYPASYTDKNGVTKTWTFTEGGTITAPSAIHFANISAVENGFDDEVAVMTAKSDADGSLGFRYGTAFFKIKIATDNITSITFTAGGRIGGRPIYDENGSITSHNDSQAAITLVADGTFNKDGVYYVPLIAKLTSNFGNLTLTFTHSNGASKDLTTTKLSNVRPVLGTVYDLGCPPISFDPDINASVSHIEYDQTGGVISYSIANPVQGGVLTAAVDNTYTPSEGCGTIANLAIDNDSITGSEVPFTCGANDGATIREGKVVLTYSYGDGLSVSHELILIQKASDTVAETHTHSFFYNSSKVVQNLSDGVIGSYFTIGGSVADLEKNYGGNYSAEDETYSYGLKMDSNGSVQFTTSATLNSTLVFYYVGRNNSATSLKLTPVGGSDTIFTASYHSVVSSGEVSLVKGTTYSITRNSQESSIILVKVYESE